MKKFFLNFSSNEGEIIILPCQKIEVNETVVVVKTLIVDNTNILLFEIKDKQINTLFDLTNVSPYELWFFDEKKVFIAKSFSQLNGNTSFQILTQARFVALIPSDNKNISQTNLITSFKCNSFKLDLSNSSLANTIVEQKYACSLDRKEQVFKTWDELLLLLELTALQYPDNEIVKVVWKIQTEKKINTEKFHTRNKPNEAMRSLDLNLKESTLKSLIKKWEELIIDAYIYLQEARKRGGTFGHKVGPIWAFQKKLKEQFEGDLLQLTYINIYNDK